VPLQVELVSPERILYSGEADMVVCRTVSGGEIAFLTGHAPFVGMAGEEGDLASAHRTAHHHVGLARVQDALGRHQLHLEGH